MKKTHISLIFAGALLTASTSSQAAIIDLELEGAVGTVLVDELLEPVVDYQLGDLSTTLEISSFNSYGFAYAESSANNTGAFFVDSEAYGTAAAGAYAVQTYTVTNNADTAAYFEFNFQVLGGSIGASCGEGFEGDFEGGFDQLFECAEDDGAVAAFFANIDLNDESVWSNLAAVAATSDGSLVETAVEDDFEFYSDTYFSESYVGWQTQDFTLDIGLLEAGESFTLSYQLATGSAAYYASSLTSDESEEEFFSSPYAYAGFGDPTGLNSSVSSSEAQEVSAPGSLAIFGLGLSALAFVRRQRIAK